MLWINAAGNLAQSTFNSQIANDKTDAEQVVLPYQGRFVRFIVPSDQSSVTAVLSWNDVHESKDYATSQDLDLVIEDGNKQVIAASHLQQSGPLAAGAVAGRSYSAHAREAVTMTLNVGTYYARIENHSHNFTSSSHFRLSLDGDNVQLLDTSGGGSLGIPADNPSVLTVGAADVPYSSSDVDAQGKATKPELVVPSYVVFSDGESHYGTSAASAIATGALAVYMGAHPGLTRVKLLELMAAGTLAGTRASGQSAYTLRLK